MRLSRAAIAERETWLRDFFKATPAATADAANVALKEKFGHAMRAQRVYELRKLVKGETVEPVAPAAVPATPAEVPVAA